MSEEREENLHGSCAERHDDLAAYALGALEAAECSALETHLEGCSTCRERLEWLRPAVDLLPASVPQTDPPPALKQDLMSVVWREAAADEATARAADAGGEGGLLRRLRYGLLGDGPLRPALAGFATICLIVAGVGGYLLHGEDDDGGASSFAALPTSPKMDGHGTVEVDDGAGKLVVEGMEPIDGGDVYQVWVAHGNEISPSSTFVVDGFGNGDVAIPDIPENANQVMITREPAGGSETPQSDPLLSAKL